jgi:aspartyl/glutamyl-tRNA(Asn/Gln) amidotransferase C subunit
MTDPKVDIQALTALARLEVSDAEHAKLEKEIPDILKFVETIQQANTGKEVNAPALRNVMRADDPPAGGPHESGRYTERLLDAAPARVGNRVAVKQVLSRTKKS